MVDFLGKEIKVGSQVVYPGRCGSNLWMNYGFVEELGSWDAWWTQGTTERPRIKVRRIPLGPRETERTVWLTEIQRVVVVGE